MSKNKINEQTEKLKNLVGSARLQTSTQMAAKNDAAHGSDEISNEAKGAEKPIQVTERPEPVRTKAKNLKAIPVTYFEAHDELKATCKTSLDFSSYIIEAIREKLERDGAIGS
ncbi:TPA: molecular chaperone GroEL [Salmonella enterica]|uniref:molecular chaperone GroEL n=1 Tax=Salmonella enterica TaxID=28901 RepID=UPI0012D63A8D|nr:molecular chaperone GroEL [Salmonella enterica subsp. enterica serovar Chester]EBX0574958.1 molecular chaperone GroEL [Salmonella enterica subsp. enterica serovar Utah]EGI6491783.1 molecular chaperone GroEL [Salmonella enterica subsp. enterica serovar Hvittingfoss]EIF2862165.1 molecular chaperone GroEL [Salmonella enterica]HEB0786218.1 molecular chaperone GroEL [Salmonella enterica]